jgi:ligand-binding SRPBCC domain-containing protein
MAVYRLETTQSLAIGLEDAWSFFSDPANLAAITPEFLGFRVTSPVPRTMHAGLIITYRVTPILGIGVDWVTEITHLDAPHYFVDEQRLGPYRFWHHQHHFRAIASGVEISDIVHYAPPTPAAPLIDRWLVGPRVRSIFDHRRKILAERFGNPG